MTRWPSACGRRAASSLDCLRRLTRRWLVATAVVTFATNIHVTWLSVKRFALDVGAKPFTISTPQRCVVSKLGISSVQDLFAVHGVARADGHAVHCSAGSQCDCAVQCSGQRRKNTPPVSANTVSLRGPMLVRCSEARDAVCKTYEHVQ